MSSLRYYGTRKTVTYGGSWGSILDSIDCGALYFGKIHILPKYVGDLANVYKYLQGWCSEDRDRLFPVVPSDRTRGNGQKLKHRRVPLNLRNHFFAMRVTEH